MLIRATDRLIPLTSIHYCVDRKDGISVHTTSGSVFFADGKDAEVIRAMVARIQKTDSGKKAPNVRKEEGVLQHAKEGQS